MNKEYLEALNGLFDLVHCQDSFEKAQKYFDIIEQALHRLESIDNAEPSEALECLEDIYRNGVFISEVSFEKQHPTNISPETNKSISVQCDTIKQALIKAQEPKHYLKWEDLEFSYGTKVRKVRMNDTIYKIAYRCCDDIKEVQLLSEDEKLLYISFVGKYKDNVQFFNDLHLERVEE